MADYHTFSPRNTVRRSVFVIINIYNIQYAAYNIAYNKLELHNINHSY